MLFYLTRAGWLTHCRKLLKYGSVLLLALHVPPPWLVKACVKLFQQGHFLCGRDGHVILKGVQGTKHQVEDADGWSGGGGVGVRMNIKILIKLIS